jgi:hypothetical protein
MSALRFIRRESDVEIRAKRKDTGKWDTFGYCHPATAKLIKTEGLPKYIHLIRLP